jgi:glucose/arabinose dehydrogenase
MIINNGMGIYLFICWMTAVAGCQQQASSQSGTPAFESTPQEYAVSSPLLTEASGMADSKTNAGCLWVEQDSGNPPDITLMKHDGTVLKSIHLAHITNRDWEDIALSGGPKANTPYLYLAETGDNLMVHPDYAIYRFEEPTAATDTVQHVDTIAFYYPDGSHNTEAILVDPDSKDIYLITKTDSKSQLFRLVYPYSTTQMNKAVAVGSLTFNFATSAAISPTGRDIVVKTYDAIYYYPHASGETIVQSLQKTPVKLPYQAEPQGEAITFANDNSGYFTISEKAFASSVKLYFYKRK